MSNVSSFFWRDFVDGFFFDRRADLQRLGAQ